MKLFFYKDLRDITIVSTGNKGVYQLLHEILEHYWVDCIIKMIILYYYANKIWIDIIATTEDTFYYRELTN